MLRFPSSLAGRDAASFLEERWQKAPLWMPSAVETDSLPNIEPGELAWLATLDDVESRLVLTESREGKAFYRVETGPFTSARLESLPDRNWTLLVQDAEKHLPDLRRFFDIVPFIPDWRIDDLMISVAAPGGSVGPHCDHYDVFLIQTLGRRSWHWTTAHIARDRSASEHLRLLQPFSGDDEHSAEPGDVLYLNPGVAHHGIAEELCVTCSIGMRAPQLSELSGRSIDGDDEFYSDEDLRCDEARPGYLSRESIDRASRLLARHGLATASVDVMLGRFATAPKEWLQPDIPGESMPRNSRLRVHGMARLAFSESRVFANGHSRRLPACCRDLVATLAETRLVEPGDTATWLSRAECRRLLEWFWSVGALETADG